MQTIAITGCNRGIGLEFVRQYAATGCQVHATCRDPGSAAELASLASAHANVQVHQLDVAEPDNIAQLAADFGGQALDGIIHNAGVYPAQSRQLDSLDTQSWLQAFQVNTIAPALLTRALLPNLAAGTQKNVAVISSKVGSIDDNQSGGSYAYRSSKSAVNQVVKSLSIDLAPKGIQVVSLHPGWVQTAMGGPNALITVETSVKGMRNILANLTAQQSGQFFNYDGAPIAW
ncbi:MAG: SDR family oxidoreductase [Lysobacterales bacterium]